MKKIISSPFFKLGALFGIAAAASGCGTKIQMCFLTNNPTTCNFYTSVGNVREPLDTEIVILGDSLFDYGGGSGAIPKALATRSNKTYLDLSVANQKFNYILNEEVKNLPKDEAGNVTVRTVIVNGGANEVRVPCSPAKNPEQTVSGACQIAITDAMEGYVNPATGAREGGAKGVLQELSSKTSIENIIWVGPQYFSKNVVASTITDYSSTQLQSICEEYPKCHYVENSGPYGAWTPSEVDADWDKIPREIHFDGYHVTPAAAETITQRIWTVLEAVGAYR